LACAACSGGDRSHRQPPTGDQTNNNNNWKTLDWEGEGGGGILNATENDFGPILYFLEIADVGEAYLIFENN
jgi:transcription elongation factor